MDTTTSQSPPINTTEGAEGSQSLVSRNWPRARVDGDGRIYLSELGQPGWWREVVLVPVAEAGQLLELLDQRGRHIDLLDQCLEQADDTADRWKRKHDELRAELKVVGAQAGWAGMLAAHLRFVAQAVEQLAVEDPDGPSEQALQAARRAAEQARAALAALDQHAPPAQAGQVDQAYRDGYRTGRDHSGAAQLQADLDEVRAWLAGLAGPDRHDPVQAQTLYAGLPNLPVEPAVADDEPEADRAA
jgi:hypothetical protein